MPAKQQKTTPGGGGDDLPAAEHDDTDYPKTTGRQDFVFAVKLFGIAGLIVLTIWWLNRIV
jgi:hypothetical protein